MIYTVSFHDLCERTWSKNSIAPSLICVGTNNMRPQAPQGEYAHIWVEKKITWKEMFFFFPDTQGRVGKP